MVVGDEVEAAAMEAEAAAVEVDAAATEVEAAVVRWRQQQWGWGKQHKGQRSTAGVWQPMVRHLWLELHSGIECICDRAGHQRLTQWSRQQRQRCMQQWR